MGNKSRAEDNVFSDPFGPFKKAARKAFAFLRDPNYGFNEVQTVCNPPECVIRYESKTTGVIISYEWGGPPSVVLSRRDPTTSSLDEEQFGLRFLVMERCPEALDRMDAIIGSADDIERMLIDYAQILKKCGHEVLTGDFRIVPKLRKLIRAEQRKTNLKLFGSETGETP